MENKLYPMEIDSPKWDGKELTFKLTDLNINDSISVHDYRCSSPNNPTGNFVTITRQEEYLVKDSKIQNGAISLNLELVDSEKALSPTKKEVKLFIKGDIFDEQKEILLSSLII